jgi:hypothetical protein
MSMTWESVFHLAAARVNLDHLRQKQKTKTQKNVKTIKNKQKNEDVFTRILFYLTLFVSPKLLSRG